MHFFRFVLAGAIPAIAPASAVGFELSEMEPCYTRTYSPTHLDAQPAQNVVALSLALRAENGFAIARLTGTDREGRFGHLSFMCPETAAGVYAGGCNTLEGDSQLWITTAAAGGIALRTRNVFLSDIGQGIDYLDDVEGHYRFYLQDAAHSYSPNTGPFFTFRLIPSEPQICAEPG